MIQCRTQGLSFVKILFRERKEFLAICMTVSAHVHFLAQSMQIGLYHSAVALSATIRRRKIKNYCFISNVWNNVSPKKFSKTLISGRKLVINYARSSERNPSIKLSQHCVVHNSRTSWSKRELFQLALSVGCEVSPRHRLPEAFLAFQSLQANAKIGLQSCKSFPIHYPLIKHPQHKAI
jgi:hypothetical protein